MDNAELKVCVVDSSFSAKTSLIRSSQLDNFEKLSISSLERHWFRQKWMRDCTVFTRTFY